MQRTRKGPAMHPTDQKIFGWLIGLTIVAVFAAVWCWLEAGDLDRRIKCLTKNHDAQQREVDDLKRKVHSLEGTPRVAACSCDATELARCGELIDALTERVDADEEAMLDVKDAIEAKIAEIESRKPCGCSSPKPAPQQPAKKPRPARCAGEFSRGAHTPFCESVVAARCGAAPQELADGEPDK